jgi:hypothetical protein
MRDSITYRQRRIAMFTDSATVPLLYPNAGAHHPDPAELR